MSNEKGFGNFPKKWNVQNKFRYFFGEKYVGYQLDTKHSSARSRKYSLRKSGAKRNALFCCTF